MDSPVPVAGVPQGRDAPASRPLDELAQRHAQQHAGPPGRLADGQRREREAHEPVVQVEVVAARLQHPRRRSDASDGCESRARAPEHLTPRLQPREVVPREVGDESQLGRHDGYGREAALRRGRRGRVEGGRPASAHHHPCQVSSDNTAYLHHGEGER